MGRYETICKDNREFIQELEDGVYDKRGALKNNVLYGNHCQKPLVPHGILVWVGKEIDVSVGSEESDRLIALLNAMCESSERARVYLVTTGDNANLSEAARRAMIPEVVDVYEYLACSGTIVSVGILPAVFHKRDGQKHIHVVTKAELARTRYARAANGISCVLSADVVICDDEGQRASLLNSYQLAGVFGGRLVVDASLEHAVLDSLADSNKDLGVVDPQKNKRKVLILHDCDANSVLQSYFRQLLASMDYDAYDVTVLSKKGTDEAVARAFVDSVDERARVILRLGSFSCSIESYVRLHAVVKYLVSYEDSVETSVLVDRRLLDEEWQRVLFGVTFDSLVNLTRRSNLWLLMSMAAPTLKSVTVEFYYNDCILKPNATNEQALLFVERNRMKNEIFNTVVVANEDLRDGLAEYVPDCRLLLWDDCTTFCAPDELLDANLLPTVGLADNRYTVLDMRGFLHTGHALLMPCLSQTKKNYLVYCKGRSVAGFVDAFASSALSNEQLFLFVENRMLSVCNDNLYRLPLDAKTVNCETIEGSALLASFLRGFDGYIQYGQDDTSRLRVLCAALGIPLVNLDGTVLQSEASADRKEWYKAIRKDRLAKLLSS